ncbi:hypothetical protein ES702_04534 [subsurface metagenome]
MSQENSDEKLRKIVTKFCRTIDQVQETFFESLRRILSGQLPEEQIEEMLADFKGSFDRLKATMQRYWETESTKRPNQRPIYGE